MLSDIEIAQACEMLPITEVADRLGIENKDLEQYGRYKAKVDLSLLDEHAEHEGKLILVTAITPTPAPGKVTLLVEANSYTMSALSFSAHRLRISGKST